MSRRDEPPNPFYWLVVLASVAFVLTALGYVASFVALRPPAGAVSASAAPSPAMQFFDRRADSLMLWEIGALTVAAVLAMGVDRWRARRAVRAGDETQGGRTG